MNTRNGRTVQTVRRTVRAERSVSEGETVQTVRTVHKERGNVQSPPRNGTRRTGLYGDCTERRTRRAYASLRACRSSLLATRPSAQPGAPRGNQGGPVDSPQPTEMSRAWLQECGRRFCHGGGAA